MISLCARRGVAASSRPLATAARLSPANPAVRSALVFSANRVVSSRAASSTTVRLVRSPTSNRSFTTSSSSEKPPKTIVETGDRVVVNLSAVDAATQEKLFDTEGEPISFIVGQGQVVVGLERRIQGTKVGETWTETFEATEAFGVVDPAKFRKIDKPKDPELLKDLAVGANVQLHTGEMAKVLKIEDDHLILDLNSSLAGRRVTFTVTLAKIENEVNNTMSGVQVQTVRPGDGKTFPRNGSRVAVHYTGTLADNGAEFDSSRRGNRPPFTFVLGAGLVIRGWDVGIGKLSLGERAMLFIPSEMGYGANGAGGVIPPNANLVFDVELVEIDGIKAANL